MTGWKQAYHLSYRTTVLVELDIPDDVRLRHIKRYGLTEDIWVCQRATVVSITSLDGSRSFQKALSLKSHGFVYETGKEVVALKDERLGNHPGIYFFKTRQQAIDYQF